VNGGQAIELARVHVKTDEETEGFGVSPARSPHAIRAIVERELKDLLIGEVQLNIEKLWNDMFRRVRNYGRKGVAIRRSQPWTSACGT
jgi:L-alanine-DL-glutamate epimerase-like enolase superfamily enzyme